MFYLRMASKPLLCLAVWTAVATYASAATPNLPSEITGLIPSCAVDCFRSFVSGNYDTSVCGVSPSLSCLCQKTGRSGFTMGEGAVQCLVAEINRGSCRGVDASRKRLRRAAIPSISWSNRVAEQTISKVYALCSGVQNAAPETHSTIVATLVVPSGTGPVQVPPGAATNVGSAQTSSIPLTSDSSTITTAMTMSTTTSPASTTTSTSIGSSSASDGTNNGPALNAAQIAGISFGIAATLGFAVGLIFFARYVRKKNFGDQESVLFRPKRESKGFGMLKSNQNSPHPLQISAPIHKTPIDMDFRRPGDFHLPAVAKPEDIGLALSPPRSIAASAHDIRVERPLSIKQPPKTYVPYRPSGQQGLEKPALTLTIPQGPEPPQKELRTLQSSRDSVMTEFQEDGEVQSARGSNIWRPPPTDPQSTTTYYVADKWGNWVLSNRIRDSRIHEHPGAMSSKESERPTGTATGFPVDRAPSYLPEDQIPKPGLAALKLSANRPGPPHVFNDREEAPGSSSVYSAFTNPASVAAGSGTSWPSGTLPLASVMPTQEGSAAGTKGGHDQSKKPKSRSGSRQNRRRSQDSATTISSSVAEENDDRTGMNADPQNGLSPVVESPRTPVLSGRSPVSYPPFATPETPERRRGQARKQSQAPRTGLPPALTLFPRPARNDHASLPLVNLQGQPSPTLGVVDVAPLKVQRRPPAGQLSSTAGQRLTRPPGLNPNPVRNPAEFKTGSPEMRSGSAPPESERQRHPSAPHQNQPYQQHHRRDSSLQLQQQRANLEAQPSTRSGFNPPHGRDNFGPSVSQGQLGPPWLPERILISPASATTSGSVDSTGSSFLLTKRLGADRAAALILGEDVGGKRRAKWQRDQGDPGLAGREAPAALPDTPGWLPKLTPTRRGDDLFLNVQ